MTPSRLVALALVLVPALGCDRPSAPTGGTPVEIGYTPSRVSLPVFVAEQEGLFQRHGLDVTLKPYETAQPLVDEVLDGRLLAGGYAALPTLTASASRGSSEVRVVGAMVEDADHPFSYLLRSTRDGAVSSIAELRGRRIGILPTPASRRRLELVLRHGGVDPADVTVTPLAAHRQVAALSDGEVDSLFTEDPIGTVAVAGGAARPIVDAPVPRALGERILIGSFLVHPRLVSERPDVVRRVVAALDEAIAIVHDNPIRARRAMLPFVPSAERAYVTRYPDARYLTSGELSDGLLEREVATEARLGILEAPPSVRGWSLGGESLPAEGP